MKKNEYVSPELEIVEIEMQGLIASSFDEGGVDGGLNPDTEIPPRGH